MRAKTKISYGSKETKAGESFIKKEILDVCCGGRMFWFDKNNPVAVYMDNREFEEDLCNGQHFVVKPDIVGDFRNIPFDDETFSLVVFDPPHLLRAGEQSWLAKKYGRLNNNWRDDLAKGFEECFRVLKKNGVLVFKWNETDIKTSDIIKLSPIPPLFGHKSGKVSKTQWMCFIKTDDFILRSNL
jgi:SAM-dependent methyltransferase